MVALRQIRTPEKAINVPFAEFLSYPHRGKFVAKTEALRPHVLQGIAVKM